MIPILDQTSQNTCAETMEKFVSVYDFKSKLSEHLGLVEGGDELIVTRNGKPIAMVAMKGRLPSVPGSINKLALEAGVLELAFTAKAAEEAKQLQQLFGTDPFDWMLVAQAQSAGCDFYTADLRLLGLGLPFIKDATL
jgi:antitoxin (DNA-binding transcriptional repressor) of toxin-antitoxin stability system